LIGASVDDGVHPIYAQILSQKEDPPQLSSNIRDQALKKNLAESYLRDGGELTLVGTLFLLRKIFVSVLVSVLALV